VGWGGESEEKGKTRGFSRDSLIGQQRKRELVTIILLKEYTKWVLHSAIVHHPEPSAQPAPEQ